MKIINYLAKRIGAYLSGPSTQQTETVWQQYAAEYKRCFDGTSEEQRRRLANWDEVHRATAVPRTSSSLINLI